MAQTINVDIVSAEGQIFAGEAAMVFVPAVQGRYFLSEDLLE